MAGGMSKIAVVTGAGSGIGRASAIALAHAGFTVVLSGRRREPLESAAAAAGDGAVALPADVRERGSVAGLFSEVEERYGRLDVLFNNAGVSAKPVPLEELDSRAVAGGDRDEPDRRVPLHPAGVSDHEAPDASWWTDH